MDIFTCDWCDEPGYDDYMYAMSPENPNVDYTIHEGCENSFCSYYKAEFCDLCDYLVFTDTPEYDDETGNHRECEREYAEYGNR